MCRSIVVYFLRSPWGLHLIFLHTLPAWTVQRIRIDVSAPQCPASSTEAKLPSGQRAYCCHHAVTVLLHSLPATLFPGVLSTESGTAYRDSASVCARAVQRQIAQPGSMHHANLHGPPRTYHDTPYNMLCFWDAYFCCLVAQVSPQTAPQPSEPAPS
jgi:hypothetical protein